MSDKYLWNFFLPSFFLTMCVCQLYCKSKWNRDAFINVGQKWLSSQQTVDKNVALPFHELIGYKNKSALRMRIFRHIHTCGNTVKANILRLFNSFEGAVGTCSRALNAFLLIIFPSLIKFYGWSGSDSLYVWCTREWEKRCDRNERKIIDEH